MDPGAGPDVEEAKVSGDAIVLCFDNGRHRIGSGVRYITAEEHSVTRRAKVAPSRTSPLAVACSWMDFNLVCPSYVWNGSSFARIL